MNTIEQKLRRQLDVRRQAGALRRLPPPTGLVDFCSNDYLGLTRCAAFRETLRRAGAEALPPGAGGSRLISGNSRRAEALESCLADVHGAEAGLLFTSGYAANTGLLAAVADRHDTILYDQLAHASIRDGLLLSRARSYAFRHNDLDHLRDRLRRADGNCFIVVESVYSMDGDEAPLPELADLAAAHGAALIVDEAHATGVFGERGEGLVGERGLAGVVWARIHTFGKAVGSHGAVVVGPGYLRDFLINFARSFVYTTALPEPTLLAVELAYRELAAGERRRQLHRGIGRFLSGLGAAARRRLLPSRSAVQSLIRPGNEAVKDWADRLRGGGYDVRPILHPSVPRGEERLRICLHADNTGADIDGLTASLNQLCEHHD